MPPITRPVRMFLLCGVLALLGFSVAAWTAGGVLPVLLGVVGLFGAAGAFMAEIETTRDTASRPEATP